MENDISSLGDHVERIDADAVCIKCGTVNPEDTFLCKVCGNNLREQRARRVSGATEVDIDAFEDSRSQWLRRALLAMAILYVVWVAINVSNNNIEEWLLR